MAEVIPGKTKNAQIKRKKQLLEKSAWKNKAFSKCKKKLKTSFSRKISGFHKSEKKSKNKQKKSCTCWKKRFFWHLEIVENLFFVHFTM